MLELFAGFIGTAIFITATYFLQKRFYTGARVKRIRLKKGQCPSCGTSLPPRSFYCSTCGEKVGSKCYGCDGFTKLNDKYCSNCGGVLLK